MSRSDLLAELPADLVHVAAQLFQETLQTVEHRVERGLIAGEVGADEILEGGRVAIVGTPELGDLLQPALHPSRAAIHRTLPPVPFPAWPRNLSPMKE